MAVASSLVVGTNAYLDVPTAQLYFNNRLDTTAWANATPDQQAQALVMGTRAIDRLTLIGARKQDISVQPLQFPRRYPYQIHDIWRKWFTVNVTDVWETLYVEGASWFADPSTPQVVLDATCEEALAILQRYGTQRLLLQRQGVDSFSVGGRSGLQERYGPGAGRGLLSQEARELMRYWVAGAVSII